MASISELIKYTINSKLIKSEKYWKKNVKMKENFSIIILNLLDWIHLLKIDCQTGLRKKAQLYTFYKKYLNQSDGN